jgi:hypothetical protein
MSIFKIFSSSSGSEPYDPERETRPLIGIDSEAPKKKKSKPVSPESKANAKAMRSIGKLQTASKIIRQTPKSHRHPYQIIEVAKMNQTPLQEIENTKLGLEDRINIAGRTDAVRTLARSPLNKSSASNSVFLLHKDYFDEMGRKKFSRQKCRSRRNIKRISCGNRSDRKIARRSAKRSAKRSRRYYKI